MGEGKRVEIKEISARTTVKAIITGYVAYGVLLGFIIFIVCLVLNWTIKQIPNANYRVLSVTIPILEIFFLNFIVHGICKLSIYDVFKKCKTNPDKMEQIHTRLNLFILICIAVSIILMVTMMILNFNNEKQEIVVSSYQYKAIHSEAFAEQLTNKMMRAFEVEKQNTIVSTIILEIGMTIVYFSIIPYQRKMIERYNQF